MSRNKLIILIAFVLVAVLAIAFGMQVKRLRTQLRSSTRIIPGDSKSREDIARQELEQGQRAARPDVLVKFRGDVPPESIKKIIAYLNDQLLDEIEAVPGLTAIDNPDDEDAETTAAQYRGLPEVDYAEPNYEISIEPLGNETNSVRPGDKRLSQLWLFSKIEVERAWAKTKGSDQVVVAILDTGVDYNHLDLANNIWTRPAKIGAYHDQALGTIDDIHGYNAVTNDGDPLDDNGHGTSAAGIIGAKCPNTVAVCGINQETKIMALKVLNAGGFGTVADAVKAVNYAIDRKHAGVNIRVIDVGWGLTQSSRALEDVIRKAGDAGILLVASSGNRQANVDERPYYPACYTSDNLVSVAAIDLHDSLAPFSNFGARSIQLAAPGRDLVTTALGNDYHSDSDTSLAAAVVSGVAALAVSAKPNLSVKQLRKSLLESVDQAPALGGKVSTGGRINAAKAVGAPLLGVR